MTEVVITIAGKEDPKAGKVRGRIKDTKGLLYQITPTLSQMVEIGKTYSVDYLDKEHNGMKWRQVESIAPAQQQFPPAPLPGAMQRVMVSEAPGQYYPAPTTDEKGTDIATLAIAKVWLERIPVGDEAGCLHALRAARRAWLQFKNNPNNVDRSEEYDGA